MKEITSARRCAYTALLEVHRGAYANLALKQALEPLAEQERSFAAALTYETLEHQRYLDFMIDHYAKNKLQAPIRVILRMGVCQLLYMDVPDSAACNESVKLAKAVGKGQLGGFINAVMRSVVKNKADLPTTTDIGILYSYPEWLVQAYIARFGYAQAKQFIAYRPCNDALCIRNCAEADLQDYVIREGTFSKRAQYCKPMGNIAAHPLFAQGKITVQGESSMLVCEIADPKKGDRVLDACAAPGGKTAYLAALMGEGSILAWDKHPHRVELIEKTMQRLHIGFVTAQTKDASLYDPLLEKQFDLVLVDAPCSGLGVIFGKPDVKYSKDAAAIDALAALQQDILRQCAHYVKPGGTLLYSTCTISMQENEDNVTRFLREHTDFAPANIAGYFPESFDAHRITDAGVQLLPHIDEVDGFYICKLIRK